MVTFLPLLHPIIVDRERQVVKERLAVLGVVGGDYLPINHAKPVRRGQHGAFEREREMIREHAPNYPN